MGDIKVMDSDPLGEVLEKYSAYELLVPEPKFSRPDLYLFISKRKLKRNLLIIYKCSNMIPRNHFKFFNKMAESMSKTSLFLHLSGHLAKIVKITGPLSYQVELISGMLSGFVQSCILEL